ncbi:hypothetical protein [Streptomyces sp. SD15]
MFGDIRQAFTGDLRRLLIARFAEAATPTGVDPAEAATSASLRSSAWGRCPTAETS